VSSAVLFAVLSAATDPADRLSDLYVSSCISQSCLLASVATLLQPAQLEPAPPFQIQKVLCF